MHRVIVVGSPRAAGRSAALADELFNACIEECPEDGVSIVSVASTDVRPCTGCDACRAESDEPLFTYEEGDPLMPVASVVESGAPFHRCVIDDDMAEVRKHLDAADELIVVAPVYFASVPAQLKALLDRLQPYFWTPLRTFPKRPATVHVVGEGGDPHGFDPLLGTVRSALSVAGFSLETALDWVGKITPEGEITADADEYELAIDESAPAWADEAADGVWVDEQDDDWGDDWDDGWDESEIALRRPERSAKRAAEGSPDEGTRGGRAKLSVAAAPANPKATQQGRPKKGGKRTGGSGGPAYGKKNTKKKGNGRGGHR